MLELDFNNRKIFSELTGLHNFLLETLEDGDKIEFYLKGVRKIEREKYKGICYYLMKDNPDVAKLYPPTFEKIGKYTHFALFSDREENEYLYLKDIEVILSIGLKIREKVGLFLKKRIKKRNRLIRDSRKSRNA